MARTYRMKLQINIPSTNNKEVALHYYFVWYVIWFMVNIIITHPLPACHCHFICAMNHSA